MKAIFSIMLLTLVYVATAQDKNNESHFIVKPYLQIGRTPSPQSLNVLWHVSNIDADWMIQYRTGTNTPWKKVSMPQSRTVVVAGIDPHRIYQVTLTDLEAGSTFTYQILKNKKIVFISEGHALKSATQPYRFVTFGDCGAGTSEQKPLANLAFASKPDFVMIPGDIVYDHGLISEYYTKFWPIYNAEKADAAGAPLIRSIPFVCAPGNHDTETRDLDKYPDGLAYYIVWDQPLNGPIGQEGNAFVPLLKASEINRKAFMKAAGEAYPRMTNFSFNYGNAHWTVIDSNPYVDWTDKALVEWVAKDLADAKDATWRFVAFHHPGFNSSREHYEQQHMRLLAPVLEAGKVDVVFNGHVHNYQRSYPLHFTPDDTGTTLIGGKDGKTIRGRVVNGRWTLDKTFDGIKNTKPNGIIYIVTGAGGQDLYNTEQQDDPDSWQKFTTKFISNIHSLTVTDVDGKTMTIRQVDINGVEVDRIVITK